MKKYILLAVLWAFIPLQSHAVEEQLTYVVKLKGAATLFRWVQLGDATITTKEGDCGRQACRLTEVWMTSEHYPLLERFVHVRFLYRSYYQEAPTRTLAFEKREMKTSAKYKPYGFRHKLSVVLPDETSIQTYKLWSEGESLASESLRFISKDGLNGIVPRVKNQSSRPIERNALDRWAMIEHARHLPLTIGYQHRFPGMTSEDKLRFDLKVETVESIEAAGKQWQTWKVRITENNLSDKERQAPLYLWVTQDKQRLPVRVSMSEDIGSIRFELSGD